jgi:hypothetical protein
MIRFMTPSESQIQQSIISWARWHEKKYPELTMLIKIPNEGKRSWVKGKQMKAEGLKKGVSDLFLAYPIKKSVLSSKTGANQYFYAGLWLEVKKPMEKPTKEQQEWLSDCKEVGYQAEWCDSVDGGIDIIKEYLGIK